jgi:uncharacterized membrane protein YkvA (DUF1232 family)
MEPWLLGLLVVLAVYVTFIVVLLVLGRREDARALGGFVPDCVMLFKRLLSDRRVPFTRKVPVLLLTGYLAMPLDVVPDFVPVAGQLDDAILVAVVLRWVLRGSKDDLIQEHWPGPPSSLAVVKRLAGV